MKLAVKLAVKNLIGAGLRTWLNVGVLSFAFIIILFYNGWIDGWNMQARTDTIEWEYAHGHLRHADYDPFDPFTITDAHGEFPNTEGLEPLLIRQASIYPEGRMISVQLKGIRPSQSLVQLPTKALQLTDGTIPAIIGDAMSRSSGLGIGDQVLIRWRDVHGAFDASSITITEVFENNVGTIDVGQVYIPIETLWSMTDMPNEATYYLASEEYEHTPIDGWTFESQKELLSELDAIIQAKKAGGSVMQLLLLGIALLAIFDTQVLSVFRRQKEIGTYISLGMTRRQVVGIFTVEGAMNAVFAAVVGAAYGIPLLGFAAKKGIAMPMSTEDAGLAIADRIYPVFGLGLIVGTVIIVIVSATIVSYMPSRRIAKMDPVQALKGKVQ